MSVHSRIALVRILPRGIDLWIVRRRTIWFLEPHACIDLFVTNPNPKYACKQRMVLVGRHLAPDAKLDSEPLRLQHLSLQRNQRPKPLKAILLQRRVHRNLTFFRFQTRINLRPNLSERCKTYQELHSRPRFSGVRPATDHWRIRKHRGAGGFS